MSEGVGTGADGHAKSQSQPATLEERRTPESLSGLLRPRAAVSAHHQSGLGPAARGTPATHPLPRACCDLAIIGENRNNWCKQAVVLGYRCRRGAVKQL